MDGCQPIGDPCNGVGLARTRRMLDEIIFAGAVLLYIGQHFPHNIVLMIPRETHLFLGDGFHHAVLFLGFFFLYIGNEPLDQIQQAVPLQNFFPQITGDIAVRVCRVACTTALTCSVGTLIEGHKPRAAVRKLGRHPHFIEVNGKINEKTVVGTKCKFLGAAVILVLVDCTGAVLPGELIFQFQCNHRDTVDRKHHINGVRVARRIAELPGTAQNIGFVAFECFGVQPGFRLEVARPQFAAHILDAVAQDMEQPLIGDGSLQPVIQLFYRLVAVVPGIFRPFFRLGLGDKFAQHIHVDALVQIMLAGMDPVAVRILPVELRVPALRRDQKSFNVPLEPFLTFVHDVPLIFSEAVLPL